MPPRERHRRTLEVVTYNVHACRGADGREDVERITAVLDEMDPDIVALQEVQWDDDPRRDQLGRIAHGLDMRSVGAATLKCDGRWFGNAVLSRLPIVEHARFELGRGDDEPRCALRARLSWAGRDVWVVTTHLGLTLRARRLQMDRLESVLDTVIERPCVVLGDFNAWIPRRDVLARFRRRFGDGSGGRTFPALRPLLTLDRIWVSPRRAMTSWRVHRSARARVASDHLPVCARLWF